MCLAWNWGRLSRQCRDNFRGTHKNRVAASGHIAHGVGSYKSAAHPTVCVDGVDTICLKAPT
jgi:hypothetical protein